MNEFLLSWTPFRKMIAAIGFITFFIHFNSFGNVLQEKTSRAEAVDTQRYLALASSEYFRK